MAYNPHRTATETQKRRSLQRRTIVVYGVFLFGLLIIASRLMELQVVRGAEYRDKAQRLHYGGITLPAKRGDILSRDSRTEETNILATNITLDLVYVDPLITDNPGLVARTLSNILLTEEFHNDCSHGMETCPRELVPMYADAFDPLLRKKLLETGSLLEPISPSTPLPPSILKLPSLVQARDAFAADIEKRISQQKVTFVPLQYGATKIQQKEVKALDIPGVRVSDDGDLIYANPEEINQSLIDSFARSLAPILEKEQKDVRDLLVTRKLRYVPIMRRIPRALSLQILQSKADSARKTMEEAQAKTGKAGNNLEYPLRSVALLPEHWRFYPDTTLGSHVVGFLNTRQEAQYGIERTFDSILRGKAGEIRTVSDTQGGQILRPEQTIEDPEDGDTIVLTIDRNIQKEVETILSAAIEKYDADTGEVIVMDPNTGRILAMANAPLFDSNNYAEVSEKEPVDIDEDRRKKIVVEVFDPKTNNRVVKAYMDDVFTASGRTLLTDKTRTSLTELEQMYDLHDISRYYMYIGENIRREVFPTDDPHVWMKFKNNVGIGAYLNRNIHEIYEPGSVEKPITMAIALDQGEVVPEDTYDDTGPVEVDEYKIDNNDHKHYGHVTMTNCLEFSINTCMTSISFKLGAKLLLNMLDRFGYTHITGVELEDELAGELPPWRSLPRSTLATISFGQGMTTTTLQVITAWCALANGGKLLHPYLVDSIIHPDGSTEVTQPKVIDQVLKPSTSETITAMLVSSADKGFAKSGKVPGYKNAGKTGTSQIAGPGGKYETGTGSTFATYAGYAPISHPQFVILVKIDRPKKAIHGATAAAPVFKEIAAFLFKYYGIPPDDTK